MAGMVHRAGRGLGLMLSTAALVACSTTLAPTSNVPAHPTAVAACTDSLGDGWQVAIKADRPDSSLVVLVMGDSLATCQTWPDARHAEFGNTATGVGRHPTPSPAVLSYLTGGRSGNLAPYFVGRVPPSGSTVRLSYLDGSSQEAVLGDGLWLAWPDQSGVGTPTLIEAIDQSGQVVSQLANPDGIQPTD
jgi:hypothetical protein